MSTKAELESKIERLENNNKNIVETLKSITNALDVFDKRIIATDERLNRTVDLGNAVAGRVSGVIDVMNEKHLETLMSDNQCH